MIKIINHLFDRQLGPRQATGQFSLTKNRFSRFWRSRMAGLLMAGAGLCGWCGPAYAMIETYKFDYASLQVAGNAHPMNMTMKLGGVSLGNHYLRPGIITIYTEGIITISPLIEVINTNYPLDYFRFKAVCNGVSNIFIYNNLNVRYRFVPIAEKINVQDRRLIANQLGTTTSLENASGQVMTNGSTEPTAGVPIVYASASFYVQQYSASAVLL